ncbi:MAG TPA: glycosyl hydrolase [Chryseosolibacter sp.]
MKSWQVRQQMAETSLLKEYPARNIGPTIQGGRIIDIDVNLQSTKEFYIAYASGGIFKTVNNGITFEPIFDNQGALGLGDIALSQSDPNTLYAGTGEKNSSRSSYAGTGVYKTTDGGKTWTHLGLAGTHHISRIVIHPQDNNTVWVAAIGMLYSNNPERGVFKSTDGGSTWKKTLFVNDSTGIIDLAINPKNPNQLWASAWERTRKAWNFKGNGEGSAVYTSNDGGNTWQKSLNGLPTGKTVGRIGLEVSPSNPNVVYAIIDNQAVVEDKKNANKPEEGLKIENFKTMSKEDFLKLDDKKLDGFLSDNGFPKKYDAKLVKSEVRNDKYMPKAIADYFGGDANANLFNTKILGAEVYRSDNGGAAWKKVNSYDLDGVFYSYGYYFAEMKVSPDNSGLVYIYGVPLLKSKDGGANWHRIDTLSGIHDIHVDHHALWINPNDSKHILLGNDGGLYQSYDEGANWSHFKNMPVGQFYTVNYDMETPYNVYGGLQDNGVLKGSSKSTPNVSKHWETIFGGDGMYVAADPRNSRLVYTGFQFGNYYRIESDKGKTTKITPQHDIGEQPLRWNWRTPLMLSKHNPDIVYMASNRVHRSMNRGETWETISNDLTKNKPYGNVPISTITSFTESPLKFGLLYVGTDDGNVLLSKDGGGQWTSIAKGLPENLWISSITPSSHDEATVFISLNAYREDNFATHLYMSTDYGQTWKSVKGNLPESVANVIIQDPVNADLLYCGLDNGTYVSLDRGNTWHLFNAMLNVASYDMAVHPRDNELIVGTHGRSVFVADVKPLQGFKDGSFNKPIVAFQPEPIRHSDGWGEKQFGWSKTNLPEFKMQYYVGKPLNNLQAQILDDENNVVRTLSASSSVGFHFLIWDVKIDQQHMQKNTKGKKKESPLPTVQTPFAPKGKYKVRFVSGTETAEVAVEIK